MMSVGVACLEVCHVGAVELWDDVQCGADDQKQLKLVDGATHVAAQTQAPDLEQCLQVKYHREANLTDRRTTFVGIKRPNLPSKSKTQ